MTHDADNNFMAGVIARMLLAFPASTSRQSALKLLLSTLRSTNLRTTRLRAELQSLSTDATGASGSSASGSKTSSLSFPNRPLYPKSKARFT